MSKKFYISTMTLISITLLIMLSDLVRFVISDYTLSSFNTVWYIIIALVYFIKGLIDITIYYKKQGDKNNE